MFRKHIIAKVHMSWDMLDDFVVESGQDSALALLLPSSHSLNMSFQNEVSMLKNEVAQLKQLLLTHKDCPITAMQKESQGYLSKPPFLSLEAAFFFNH